MIDWPENVIPYPSRDYATSNNPRLLVQSFDVGTRQRKRFTDEVETIAVKWQLTRLQWAYFKSFVSRDLSSGAESTSMTIVTVNGLERSEVRFIEGAIQYQDLAPDAVDVTATLELIGPAVLSDTLMSLIDWLDGETNDDNFIFTTDKLLIYIDSLNSTYP